MTKMWIFQWMHDAIFGYIQEWSWCIPGVHAMITLKYLIMRHTYDSDMQTNICNAICMVLCAWRCNDEFSTVFYLDDADADADSSC